MDQDERDTILSVAAGLEKAMAKLRTEGTNGENAVWFLNAVGRLESYPPQSLEEAGVAELAREAVLLRERDGAILPAASAWLAPAAAMANMTVAISTNRVPVEHWVESALMVATVSPWLTPEKQADVQEALRACIASVRANPKGFVTAAAYAVVRSAYELTPPLAADFMAVLTAIPVSDVPN
jgi:hypothetical protein